MPTSEEKRRCEEELRRALRERGTTRLAGFGFLPVEQMSYMYH